MEIEESDLQDIADAVDGEVYEGYSGRGMMGRECPGITCDMQRAVALGVAIATQVDEATAQWMGATVCMDQLGTGMIFYWPNATLA